MSDTTHEAPERIWASSEWRRIDQGKWWDANPGGDAEEYVRADLIAAHVAAALREAADVVEDYCSDAPDLAGHGHSGAIRDAILALIPDGGAALDRVVAAEVRAVKDSLTDAAFSDGWNKAIDKYDL